MGSNSQLTFYCVNMLNVVFSRCRPPHLSFLSLFLVNTNSSGARNIGSQMLGKRTSIPSKFNRKAATTVGTYAHACTKRRRFENYFLVFSFHILFTHGRKSWSTTFINLKRKKNAPKDAVNTLPLSRGLALKSYYSFFLSTSVAYFIQTHFS